MLRILRRKARMALFAMVMGIGAAQAHQMLYDQDGYRLAVGIEAGLGGFAVGNVDTGVGNVNTDAPLEGPFPPAERRVTREWFEGFVKPFAELETPFFDFGHTYALVSVVGALTRAGTAMRRRAWRHRARDRRPPTLRSTPLWKTRSSAGIPAICLPTLSAKTRSSFPAAGNPSYSATPFSSARVW